ncbi:MAG: peptidylprolyl isomerase [Cyclobacteriaceae bacterium]|nr:peptidylprolyl isomerase [Cyclobacteriaceae bacterium]
MKRTITALFVTVLLITSCAQDKKDYVVTIKTSYGDMVAILYDETPKHKENFIKLAKEHYFDSLLFHRVIQGFMIQGGDPNSKKAKPGENLGTGGPGYTVDAEFVPQYFHEKGALSAARMGDQVNPTKASSGSQFYIVQGTVISPSEVNNLRYDQMQLMTGLRKMFEDPANKPLLDSLNQLYFAGDMQAYQARLFALAPRVEKATGLKVTRHIPAAQLNAYTTVGGAPHLDGQYTVFGKVIKGLEVIDKIAAVQRDGNDRPVEDIRMMVTVEEMPKKKITKEYGYEYPATKK